MKTYPIKCRITAGAAGPARVDVYDDIGGGDWLGGGISASDFAGQMAGVKGPLDVHINSGGGDVFDGIAISQAIRGHKGAVTTIVDGVAASIASVIFQAGQQRVMTPGSMLMIHDAFGGIVGNAAEVTKFAQTLDKVSDNLAAIYAERAGGTAAAWREAMRTESWYTADEAVAQGLADRMDGGAAALPPGLDLAAFAAVPGRIAAALRSLPVAAGARHEPMTGTHAHPHPAYGGQGGDEMHSHEHTHDGDANHGHDHAQAHAGGGFHAAAGPYEPKPYHRDPDETVQCPKCGKYNDTDARYCDQCGLKLTGRDDVKVSAHAGPGPRAAAGDEQLGDGWVRGADGRVRFDPDGDGDDDSTPEGDTDHDYFAPDGTPIKPVPPCPVARNLGEAQIRAILREELRAAGFAIADKISDGVRSQFLADLKNDSPTDIAAGMRRLSQWAASGHYPTGTTYDDLKWFYDQCADELKRRDPKSTAGGNFPPEKKSSAAAWRPEDLAEIRGCHALVTALHSISEAAGGGKNAHTPIDISGIDLETLRDGLKGAFA